MNETKLKVIETYWQMYRESAIHKDAGDWQISETKKAFYSGAGTMFRFITSETLTDAPEVIDEALKLDVVENELAEYAAEIDAEIKAEENPQ